MGLIFGVLGLCFGLRGLYGYYLMQKKNDLSASYLLPKGVDVKNCKDIESYCKETRKLQLMISVTAALYGITDLYNTYVGGIEIVFQIMLVVLLVALIAFAIISRKYNQKYFDL